MSDAYFQTTSFSEFARILDPTVYRPLPEDWLIGMTDVIGSTKAIARGAYKAVNMAGAAVIAAVANAIGHRDFPFVFGGDGASFAIAPADRPAAETAMTRTMAWVETDLDLALRAALIPVSAIRAAGLDMLVARYAVSDAVGYAMFSGGGLRWAETKLKAGHYALAPDRSSPPELTGLSCRWAAIPARRGAILSLIVEPLPGAARGAFAELAKRIVAIFEADPRHGHPVPETGPGFTWPPKGLAYEAKAARKGGSLGLKTLSVGVETLFAYLLDVVANRLFKTDIGQYRRYTALNTDFRKFDDALRLTVDCSGAQFAETERLLADAFAQGIARYGMHRQEEALMTCFVPSVMEHAHFHFLDGADGGYAQAATQMKAMAAA